MASAAMVVYCFDTLEAHFAGSDEPAPRFDTRDKLYVARSCRSLFSMSDRTKLEYSRRCG